MLCPCRQQPSCAPERLGVAATSMLPVAPSHDDPLCFPHRAAQVVGALLALHCAALLYLAVLRPLRSRAALALELAGQVLQVGMRRVAPLLPHVHHWPLCPGTCLPAPPC